MAELPPDFDKWQHLLEQLTATYNLAVEQSFIGVEPDITTPMGGLKVACLLTPDDTVSETVLRMFLFYFCLKGNLPQPIYGMPVPDYDALFRYHPQVKLYFVEDPSENLLVNHLSRATADISFRLINETPATITPATAKAMAVKIKEIFGGGVGYTWMKGKIKVHYKKPGDGMDLRIYAESLGEGQRLIQSILEVAGKSLDESAVSYVTHEIPPGDSATLAEIYGKERRKPRRYPITRVRFTRAELLINGLGKGIVLIDRTGKQQGLVPSAA